MVPLKEVPAVLVGSSAIGDPNWLMIRDVPTSVGYSSASRKNGRNADPLMSCFPSMMRMT